MAKLLSSTTRTTGALWNPTTLRRKVSCRCMASAMPGESASVNQPACSKVRRSSLRALVASIAAVGVSGMKPIGAQAEDWTSLTDEEWQERLGGPNAMPYRVLRRAATERPFTSPLNKEYSPGTFVCAGCGSRVFDSSAKFNSGTGWPSFTQALPNAVDESDDNSIVFMPRTEVSCHTCHGHLGHVFPDGPPPTGLRYCMNGAALKFIPR
jgi:peptide-methionine (R)-S-oxide reductase